VLLHNLGDGTFEDFENQADRTSIRNPMGIDGADLDRDGDLDYYVSNIGSHPLLINNGDGTFTDETAAWGSTGDFGWGLAFEDFDLDGWTDLYDNDGRVDVIWARTDGSPITVHHDETEVGGRHWLTVDVPETPETGERGGIGARVVVKVGGTLQFRDLTGGSSRASENALSVRFGLDGWDGADVVFVAWPDGRTRSYVNVPADAVLHVTP
jgi:hypothetical protein